MSNDKIDYEHIDTIEIPSHLNKHLKTIFKDGRRCSSIFVITKHEQWQVPPDLLPKSSIHALAVLRGARARLEGKAIQDNPYNMYKAAAFFNAWNHGWIAADMGDAKLMPKEERQ